MRVFRSSLAMPKTYGDCCAGTDARTSSLEQRLCGRGQCVVYACRNNLLVLRSEDVQGRRHNGRAPEWTVSGESDASSPSCALDVANQGAKTCAEIAELTGLTKRRIQQLVKQGVEALKDAGVDVTEFLALMRQEQERERRK